METLSANFRPGLRDSALGVGLADLWRWWTGELRALVPARLRTRLDRVRRHPVVVFGPGGAAVWALDHSGGTPGYTERARIPLSGDGAAQAGRTAMESVARRGRSGVPRVVLALTPQQVLRKQLIYPAAVEPNLAQVLSYDLDRHTPFKADELYYDFAITGRDSARNALRVELVTALRGNVDQLRRQIAAWGAEVVAIVPELPQPGASGALRFNLLPEDDRVERPWRRWQLWIPLAIVLALAAAAVAIPLVQKRAQAIALLHQVEQARVQAGAADALRTQLEQSVEDYNFVLARKYAYPSTLQLLDDVTRLLPDDTWLTQLELKTMPKGKEQRKEILLRGESANAGRLISLLEESKLFEQAAPRSPTTKIQPGPGEIFDVGAQLKPLGMPSAMPIGLIGSTTPAGTGPAPAPGAPPSVGAPMAPGTPAAMASGQPATPAASPGSAASASAPTAAGTPAPAITSAAPARRPPPAPVPPAPGVAAPAAAPPAPPVASAAGPAPPVVTTRPAVPAGPRTVAPRDTSAQTQAPERPSFGPVSSDGRMPGEDN